MVSVSLGLLITPVAFAQGGSRGFENPFTAPTAKIQYAPDRQFDLQHVAITTNVDYAHQIISGTTLNTVAPLRGGLKELVFNRGKNLTISEATVAGKVTPFIMDGETVRVISPTPFVAGKPVVIGFSYTTGKEQGGSFGAGGGVHWVTPTKENPARVGFWTQGETSTNREWMVTWDYPNDFATTETITTVPADWRVIGNGIKTGDTVSPDKKTRTVHWSMAQPHATYLISLVGGPMDVKTSVWQGVPLVFAVPKGQGKLIDDSFGDTADMLTYYSQITGVKYPWPKYAQDAVFDFNGGMENVSATTLTESSLTDSRAGFRRMASLNSHELGHQWFGDFVTCKTWGDAWLNESFATFMQMMYFEHSRGKNSYDYEVEGNTNGYLQEARRYKRPLSTKLYANPDVMFDQHTYPKGGVILHTLRKQLGDKAFWAGIQHYLTVNQHHPVEAQDLCMAMTESSGINCQPFFDQWIYKPGHPVLDWSYTYDANAKSVVVTVKQTQDTTDGTPIYTVPTEVGIIVGTTLTRVPVTLDAVENKFTIPAPAKPDAVLLDPDRDFLRDIPKQPWTTEGELIAVVRSGPNGPDRQAAMENLLALNNKQPSSATLAAVTESVTADTAQFPALTDLTPLVALKSEALRPVFRTLLTHASMGHRTDAIKGLAALPKDDADVKTLRAFVNDTAPYAVVAESVKALAIWDAKGNADVIAKAAGMSSRPREIIRTAALPALAKVDAKTATDLALRYSAEGNPSELRGAGLSALAILAGPDESSPVRVTLRNALLKGDQQLRFSALRAIGESHNKVLLPELQGAKAAMPKDTPPFIMSFIDRYIAQLEETK